MANSYLLFNNNNNNFYKIIIELAGKTADMNQTHESINLLTLMNLAALNHEEYLDTATTFYGDSHASNYNHPSYAGQNHDSFGNNPYNTEFELASIRRYYCSYPGADGTSNYSYYPEPGSEEEIENFIADIQYVGNTAELFSSSDPYSSTPTDIYDISYENFAIIKNYITKIPQLLCPADHPAGEKDTTYGRYNNAYIFYDYCPPSECKNFTFISSNDDYNGFLYSNIGIVLARNNYTIIS